MSDSNDETPKQGAWPRVEDIEPEMDALIWRGCAIMVFAFAAAFVLLAVRSFPGWGHLSPP